MCDYGRLNFHFVNSTDRLTDPQIRHLSTLETASWAAAIARAGEDLKRFQPTEIAVIASGRMTNEELWLAKWLVDSVKAPNYEIVPRTGPANALLLNHIRQPKSAR